MNNSSPVNATAVLSQIGRLIENGNTESTNHTSSSTSTTDRTELSCANEPTRPQGQNAAITISKGASTNRTVTDALSLLPSGFQSPQPPQSRRSSILTASVSRPARKRSSGTIGHIRMWNKDVVMEEVASVFASIFNVQPDELLEYEYLQTMPDLKRLKRPPVSSSYTWNGSEVASLAGQGVFDIVEYLSRRLIRDPFMLSVDRDNSWRDASMFYKRPINRTQPLRIVFAGDSKLGIDGGARREFFQLLVHHLASTAAGFFEGSGTVLLPVMKRPALRLRYFRIVGTIIAHSIINGGMGWTNSVVYNEREQLFAILLLHEMIWICEAAINQIMQGLALLDVLDLV